jgi:hypothetical protein
MRIDERGLDQASLFGCGTARLAYFRFKPHLVMCLAKGGEKFRAFRCYFECFYSPA